MSTTLIIGLLPLLTSLIPFIFVILIVVYAIKTVKRFEKRADEKLAIERENNSLLQAKVNDMNERLITIEKMLKEVE